ncbi:hypothetical protein Bbelb_059940 [Branchiostoma belcheri]|nr:hypothetical protein Bbelb_059940 [Branchiostoma belcheri]
MSAAQDKKIWQHLCCKAFVIGSDAASQDKRPTKWRHIDPLSGSILFCDWCEPGFYMNRVCTEWSATECLRCPWGQYMDHFNREYECRRCSNCRHENERVKRECSATNNRICRCDDGYYRLFEFCLLHKKCPIGSGVSKKGTPERDTKCSRCKSGTFSSTVSATEPCRSHTNCSLSGECVVRMGNHKMDNLCGTCVTNATDANVNATGINSNATENNATIIEGNSTAKNNISFGVTQPKFSNPALFSLVLIAIPVGILLYLVVAMINGDLPMPWRVRASDRDEASGLILALDHEHISHICEDVGKRWKQLARDELGFSDGECEGFENDHGYYGQREIVYKMLVAFIQRRDQSHPQAPTVGDLCDALGNVGRGQVAQKLMDFARNGP